MACCGDDDERHKQEGVVGNRGCRDVLFLLLFIGYWAGMFVVCGIAFQQGDPRRLVYGIDSRGLLCGSNNTYNGSVMDLTDKPNLYYLNALELLDAANIMYAKTVCVASCPTVQEQCAVGALPCTNASQYRCPYARTAEGGLWGKLPAAVAPTEVAYWGDLSSVTLDSAACNGTFLQLAASAANLNLTALGVDVNMCAVPAGSAVSGRYLQASSQFPGRGPCYPVWAATVPYFNRCFPKFPASFTGSVYSVINTTSGVLGSAAAAAQDSWGSDGSLFSTYIADISKGVLIIVIGGLGCGMALSLLYMLILRYLAGFMVWFTICFVDAALLGCTLYAFNMAGLLAKAGQWGAQVAAQLPTDVDPTGMSRENWAYIAYALAALTALIWLLTLVMLRRISVAVACIKVASQAVSTMPSILLWPLLPFVLEVGLIIYWVAVTAVLFSAGQPTPHWRQAHATATPLSIRQLALTNSSMPLPPPAAAPSATNMTAEEALAACAASADCYVSYDWDAKLKYAFIFHFFGLLWSNQFIVGLSSVVVAAAVAQFYWASGDTKRQPTFPVLKALRTTVVYSLGSIAIGSFIIAVIQFVRVILEYVDKKTRTLQQQNKVAEWLMCLVRGLMWLLEKIVAFINRNAFVLVAVKGTSYCSSAGRAVTLVVNNALRLAAVNIVGDALLFLGKLGIAAGCGVAAFGISNLEWYHDAARYPATYLSSAILPIALAVLTGYVVAQIFFAVYEMAIDTLLLCFCEDCEANGGRARCAPPLLLDAVGEQQQPAAAALPAAHTQHHQQQHHTTARGGVVQSGGGWPGAPPAMHWTA